MRKYKSKIKEELLHQLYPDVELLGISDDHLTLYCKDKYGLINLNLRYHVYKKHDYTIKCAVDKASYWRNMMTEINGYKYDYSLSVYIGNKNPVTIICKKHGEFKINPNDHTSKKSGCPKCGHELISKSRTKNTEGFINSAIRKHGNKYDYSKTNYNGYNGIITIICPIHGEIMMTAKKHLYRSGCDECGRLLNKGKHCIKLAKKNIDQYKKIIASVYSIRCSDNNEVFFKIGITKGKISYRINSFPYHVELLEEINTNLYLAIDIESKILNKYSEFKYSPLKHFGGHTECFTKRIFLTGIYEY